MPGKIVYFDCFSGASGDMLLGALVEAGASIEVVNEDLSTLRCEPVRLRTETVRRAGIRATKVDVETSTPSVRPRRLAEITHIVRSSSIPERAKRNAIRTFERLATAEARVHDISPEEVHFHEVGALDSIADVVGVCCALERLGVTEVRFSTVRLGRGSVRTAHGTLPVPAPATVELLAGFRCELGPVEQELTTPTGAALLTTLGTQEPLRPFRILKTGYGAGTRDIPDWPNVLRLFLCGPASCKEADAVWIVETNLDDTTPEVCGHVLELLLARGALDAYITPIQMKKSRPAWKITAIADETKLEQIEDTLLRETPTLGVRRYRAERTKIERRIVTVETPWGEVGVKVGLLDGRTVTVSPEYEDCLRIAKRRGIPLHRIMEAARRSFARRAGAEGLE